MNLKTSRRAKNAKEKFKMIKKETCKVRLVQKEIELVLVKFNQNVLSDEVLTYLKLENLTPGRFEHLVAFSLSDPYLDADLTPGSIISLGSIYFDSKGTRECPCLLGGTFDHRKYDDLWEDYWTFLAVCQ